LRQPGGQNRAVRTGRSEPGQDVQNPAFAGFETADRLNRPKGRFWNVGAVSTAHLSDQDIKLNLLAAQDVQAVFPFDLHGKIKAVHHQGDFQVPGRKIWARAVKMQA